MARPFPQSSFATLAGEIIVAWLYYDAGLWTGTRR
jgi:hypothetical protein